MSLESTDVSNELQRSDITKRKPSRGLVLACLLAVLGKVGIGLPAELGT